MLWMDLRFALRSLRARWLASATMVVTLVVALAMSACLFAIVDALILKPFPFRQPGDLYVAGPVRPSRPGQPSTVTWDQVRTLQGANGVAGAAGFVPSALFESRFAEQESLVTTEVTAGFFDVLGIAPQLGRPLLPEDAGIGGPPAVVLGNGLWRRQFGAAADVVGRTVTLGGKRVVVIGVMPRGMDFPWGTNVWASATPPRWTSFMFAYLWAVLRAPGASPRRLMVEASPFMVKPLKTFFRPDGIVSVTALYAGSLVIILIAWIHLGVIQTTRAIAGQRETAMRAVLGANTGALMRRWMVEGSVLGIVSLSATYLAMPAVLGVVVALLPASFTRGQPVAVDHRVLAYLSVLTCVGILALALGPVVIVRQTRLTDALRGRPSGWPRFGYHRVRLVLLGLQVGLATAVLYLAATAVHDFIRIRGVDVGFDVQHVVSIEVPAAPGGSGTVSEALRSLPFVIGVAPGTIPLLDGKTLESVSASKPQGPEDFKNPNALSVSAAPGYFKALGLTIMEGDDFGHAGSSDGVLLSAALVQRLRLTRPVVGQNLYVGGLRKTVVGMVSDIRGDGPDAGPSPFVYDKGSAEYRTLLIRTSRPVAEVLGHLVDTVRAGADVRGPLRVVLASDRYKAATADLQARMTLLFLLAASGFGLGAIGVFATTTEVVRRRARDTAVRLALGQRPSDVVWNVVRQAVLSSLVGGAVGLAVGAAAASLASAFTPGRSGADPLAAVVVAALLVGSASLASLGPAIRVARADPLRMLREE